MSCYVNLQLIFPLISSVFCNLPCRRNTPTSFKTVLYLHKISIFLTLVRKVCRKQSPAETWIELQGSNSVGGGGAVCTALTLYRALPLLAGYSDVCIYLRRLKVTDRPWPFPKSTQVSVTEEETGPQCVSPHLLQSCPAGERLTAPCPPHGANEGKLRFSPSIIPQHICTNNEMTHLVHGNILFWLYMRC